MASALFSSHAAAQNTGGIFPPMVDEGHASVQYRFTYDAFSQAAAQRIHFQRAFNDDLMWRLVLQTQHPTLDSIEFHYVQAELFWEFSKPDDRWKSGVRFDAQVRDAQHPMMVGLHWTHQFKLRERLYVRGILLSTYDVGTTEIGLQTRGSIFADLAVGPTLGIEFFNSYGTTQGFSPIWEQKHQIGVFSFLPLFEHWNVFVGFLSGLTPASPSLEFRTWLTVNL